jgi:hypothetical protein
VASPQNINELTSFQQYVDTAQWQSVVGVK